MVHRFGTLVVGLIGVVVLVAVLSGRSVTQIIPFPFEVEMGMPASVTSDVETPMAVVDPSKGIVPSLRETRTSDGLTEVDPGFQEGTQVVNPDGTTVTPETVNATRTPNERVQEEVDRISSTGGDTFSTDTSAGSVSVTESELANIRV